MSLALIMCMHAHFCLSVVYDLVLSKPLNLLLARSSHSTVHLELLPTKRP